MYVFLATLHQPWSLVFLKPEFVAPKGLLVDLHRKKTWQPHRVVNLCTNLNSIEVKSNPKEKLLKNHELDPFKCQLN